jgi:hypothetical protein
MTCRTSGERGGCRTLIVQAGRAASAALMYSVVQALAQQTVGTGGRYVMTCRILGEQGVCSVGKVIEVQAEKV